MEQAEKKTLGQHILDLEGKTPDSLDPVEITSVAYNSEYLKGLHLCVEKTLEKYQKDFYITAIRVKVPLMQNKAYKLLFKSRISCPSPQFDEDAWKYTFHDGKLEFLWSVPDPKTCYEYKDNALIIEPEERCLRDFAIDFLSGDLLRRSKKLNNEKDSDPGVILSLKRE